MSEQVKFYEGESRSQVTAPVIGRMTVLEALAQDTNDISVNLSNASTKNSGADLDDQ